MTAVQVKGLDQLLRKVDSIQGLRVAVRALRASAAHIKGKVNTYPASTVANSPGVYPKRWYERGYGSRWARKSGGVGGRKTSETLGRKWTTAQRNGGLTQVVGNNVSYGPYVQDKKKQTRFHGARGWKTIQDVTEQEADTIVNFVKAEIDRALSK